MVFSKDYEARFSRNIGILDLNEQAHLLKAKVGIAGLGGLGGQTFINLVRMGIGRFAIADIDTFDIANSNRQIGASKSTYGKTKVEVMASIAKDINPELEITEWNSGIQKESVDSFVSECDIIVDSLDFFCLTPRQALYESCKKLGKTVILSAPLGFSATLHAFSKNSMSAEDFFAWTNDMNKFDRMIHFAAGIAPEGLHLKYLKFNKQKLADTGTGPSISCACGLGAALLSNEILMALLQKRPLFEAPYYTQLDLYIGKYKRSKLHWGNRGLLQKIKINLAKRHYNDIKIKLSEHIK